MDKDFLLYTITGSNVRQIDTLYNWMRTLEEARSLVSKGDERNYAISDPTPREYHILRSPETRLEILQLASLSECIRPYIKLGVKKQYLILSPWEIPGVVYIKGIFRTQKLAKPLIEEGDQLVYLALQGEPTTSHWIRPKLSPENIWEAA